MGVSLGPRGASALVEMVERTHRTGTSLLGVASSAQWNHTLHRSWTEVTSESGGTSQNSSLLLLLQGSSTVGAEAIHTGPQPPGGGFLAPMFLQQGPGRPTIELKLQSV